MLILLLSFRLCNTALSTMAVARSSANENYDMEEIWGDLKTGIEQIFARQTLPRGRFMQLYSHVYNYCTSVTVEDTLKAPKARATRTKKGPQQTKANGAQFVGQELYKRLKDFLKAYQDGLLRVRSNSI